MPGFAADMRTLPVCQEALRRHGNVFMSPPVHFLVVGDGEDLDLLAGDRQGHRDAVTHAMT